MLTNRFDFSDVIDVITFSKVNCNLAVRRGLLENFQSVHHFFFCLGWSDLQERMIKKWRGMWVFILDYALRQVNWIRFSWFGSNGISLIISCKYKAVTASWEKSPVKVDFLRKWVFESKTLHTDKKHNYFMSERSEIHYCSI